MEHQKIFFEHDNAIEGGIGIESAWAIPIGDYYQLDNILFYVLGYSWKDIVATETIDGEQYVKSIIQKSGHSTIRIIFEEEEYVEPTREHLQLLGCDSEISDVYILITVDVPPTVDIKKVLTFLENGKFAEKWVYEEADINW